MKTLVIYVSVLPLLRPLDSIFAVVVLLVETALDRLLRIVSRELYHIVVQILTDIKNSFTGTLCKQFVIKSLLNIPPHLNCVATLPRETLMQEKLTIALLAAASSCARRLFEHFRKFRPRSQQMIRTTLHCVRAVSLDISDVLNYVFVAGLLGLLAVHQQRSVVTFSSVRAWFILPCSPRLLSVLFFPRIFFS